jgi:thiosulfate/3-mercaptopyruvate sulfurtransferase
LPSAEAFAGTRARLGLGSKPVVAYDDLSGSVAARLWWMLDAIGHPAAVLDGGMQGWKGELESGEQSVEPDEVTVMPWPKDRFVDADQILHAIDEGAVVVDARSAERFAGRQNPIDARPGHIPGSVSRPWTDNLDADGRLLPVGTLTAELTSLGVSTGADVIASCGSGVTGCHDLLVTRVAGVAGGRLYTGSWSEWSQDETRPVETDL